LNIFLNGQNICSLSPSRVVTDQATIFDGTIDFGGGSGGDFPNLEGQSSCVILVDNPAQLAGFIGGMQTCIDALAIGTSTGTGAGNLITQFNTEAGVGIEATFLSFKATGTPFSPTCAGGTNGGVNLTVTNNFNGMAANFSYEWKNSNNQIVGMSKDLSGVGAGTYTVKVTYTNPTTGNSNSCTYTFMIEDPTPVTCTTSNIVDVKCFGQSTGSFKVNASGGAGGYMYSKDNGMTFQASNEFKNLPAGNYTVVVKDMNGCLTQMSCPVEIKEPTALGCSFVEQKDVDCFGGSNGSLKVTGTGGTSPYKYKIKGASGGFLNNNGIFTGLSAGKYTIEIEDKNGCKTECAEIEIKQPMDISAMVTPTNAACEGVNTGTITVSNVSGGTPGYTYSIDGNNFQANATFNNVAGGNYTVTVKDSKGCTKTFPTMVGFNSAINFDVASTKETCGNDGTITISNVSGGSGGYTYALDNNPFGASPNFNGLKAGNYTVKVMDSQGCMTSKMIEVGRVPALSCSLQKTDVSCRGGNDGTITVTGSGGKEPYQYKLGNGSFGTSNAFTGLTAGEYTVTIKDDNGCESTCTIMVGQPAQDLSCSTSVKDVKCNGDATGEITVTATGGNGGYQYKLGNGNFQGSNKFTGLTAGDYTITVKDSKGCETTCNAKIKQPDAITCNSVAQTTTCAGGGDGKITAMVMGGVGPYMYKLVKLPGGTEVRPFQSSNEFLNLPAGQYDVVVKDANNCETSCDPIIGIEVPEPAPIICTATPTDATCKGFGDGMITVVVNSGGVSPFTYKLGNGMFQESNKFNNLAAGMYTVTVKDKNGCTSTCMAEVKEPTLLTFSMQVDCERQGEGGVAVILNIMGGTPPYRYQVNAGNVFNVPNDNTIFLQLGQKSTVKIFDKNNCSEQKDVTPVCCSFAAECKLSSTEQQVEGCNVSAVPPAFTKPSDVFKNITEIPCGTLRMFHEDETSGTLCNGGILVTRTYTLYDDANNNTQLDNNEESATCVQKFRVKDTTKPSVSGTLTGCFKTEQEAKDAAIAATTAMDVCDPNPMKSATVTSQGNCMFKVKVTATDACGNSESIEYTVKIDGEAPNFTVPADTEVSRNNQCGYDASPSVTGNPTNITDNCDANLMATHSDEIQPDGNNCNLVIKRTWKVQDNCGNKTEKVQTITVKDNTPPSVMKGEIASCYPTKEEAEAAAIAATSASDNCSANPKKTATTSGTCTAQITVTVEDDCGKKSSVTYNTRIDNTKPSATKGTIASCYATKAEAEAA
ncbi:MAG TPA: choice-of-anchor E domain-containing protein, partial [Saprospiraceae bacterium]|nr:choice-of-anchor E domain-containing protein [Saprospiraceae bacterium]